MKSLSILTAAAAAALLAASPALAREPIPPTNHGGWEQAPADCPLTISFASYGPGIDQPTLARVERRLRSDRRVRTVSRHRWGREGEVTLCARPRRAADAARIAREIRAMIPARPRGPIEVTDHRVR